MTNVVLRFVGWPTGRTLTFSVYEPDGTPRATGTATTETPADSGVYIGTAAVIFPGDSVAVKEGSVPMGGGIFRGSTYLYDDAITAAKYDESTAFPVSEKQSKAALTIVLGTVVADGGNSTTQFKTNLASAVDSHYNGRIVIFITGTLAYQATDITAYNGATKIPTVTEMTGTPAADDTFVVI